MELFAYRLAKSLFGLGAALEKLDALVFTGGIGENSPIVREKTVAHLGLLGLKIDPERNRLSGKHSGGCISPAGTPGPAVLVIPTNEEWMIARETAEFCQ
jgi:acetate kinase